MVTKRGFRIPMNLQLFAEGGEGSEGEQQNMQKSGTQQNQQNVAPPAIDYDKLASIIAGKQTVTEDTILKNYFKQQGMSKEEMDAAITTFKEQKKAKEPDVGVLQTEIANAKQLALTATIEKEGVMIGLELGLDVKTIPYILKMVDTKSAVKEDGTIDNEKLKEEINAILTDIPALKPDNVHAHGFSQLGSSGGNNNQGDQGSVLAGIFGNKQ